MPESASSTLSLPPQVKRRSLSLFKTSTIQLIYTTYTLGLDLIGLSLTFSMISLWRLGSFRLTEFLSPTYPTLFGTVVLIFYILGLYTKEHQESHLKITAKVIVALFLSTLLITFLSYLLGGRLPLGNATGRVILIGSFGTFTLWAIFGRITLLNWINQRSKNLYWLVLASPHILEKLWQDFTKSHHLGQFHALLPKSHSLTNPRYSVLGEWESCPQWLQLNWTGIIVSKHSHLPKAIAKELMTYRLKGGKVVDLAEFYEQSWFKVPIFYLKDSWFTMAPGFKILHIPMYLRVKRVLDVTLSLLLLIVSAPIMILTALLIYLADPKSPIIYTQKRMGEGGQEFLIYKFRSMQVHAQGDQWTSPKDNRITPIGKLIRPTRVDELPQLMNVLKGNMSFIGPRPESLEIIQNIQDKVPYYHLRHTVKPGITGWAQVLYKYSSSSKDIYEKFQYDLFYIKNYSLLLDLTIILRTIRTVLSMKGR